MSLSPGEWLGLSLVGALICLVCWLLEEDEAQEDEEEKRREDDYAP